MNKFPSAKEARENISTDGIEQELEKLRRAILIKSRTADGLELRSKGDNELTPKQQEDQEQLYKDFECISYNAIRFLENLGYKVEQKNITYGENRVLFVDAKIWWR